MVFMVKGQHIAKCFFDFSDGGVGVKDLFDKSGGIFRLILGLHFNFDADVSFDGNFSSLNSDFDHFFVEVEKLEGE